MEIGLSEVERRVRSRSGDGEKLIISMLCELYKHLKIDGDLDPLFVEEALHSGHYWALRWQYPGLFDREADSIETVHEVVDVLSMWRSLEQAYAGLSEKDKDRVKQEAEPFGDDVVFRGFDGNEETEYLIIARFMIDKLKQFTHFGGRDLNSHMLSIERHRRMVRAFKPIRSSLSGDLPSAGHIIKILNAQRDGL